MRLASIRRAPSYSAHNPTLTPSIAFSTWHSGGFQAIDITNPATPTQLAEFKPTPLTTVQLEDPRLSSDCTVVNPPDCPTPSAGPTTRS